MSEVIIYKAPPKWAGQARDRLRAAGVDARIVHQPGPVARQSTGFTLVLEVAVPRDQADTARSLLAEWEAEGERRTTGVGGRLVRDFVLSLLPPALVLLAGFRFASEAAQGMIGLAAMGVWLVTIVAMGKLQKRDEPYEPRMPD